MSHQMKFVSFDDHCAAVAECRRLLALLKAKYEEELQETRTALSRTRARIEDLKLENQRLQDELKETRTLLDDCREMARKRALMVLRYQQKNVEYGRELQNALHCLEDLTIYTKSVIAENKDAKRDAETGEHRRKQYSRRIEKRNRCLQLKTMRKEKNMKKLQFKCQSKLHEAKRQWTSKQKRLQDKITTLKHNNKTLRREVLQLRAECRDVKQRRPRQSRNKYQT